MKRAIFLLIIIFYIGGIELAAQSYHPFPDDKIRVYELDYYGETWESFAIQINERDTVNGSEVLFFNNQVINDYSDAFLPTCLRVDGGSWFAKLLRISLSSGDMTLYNEDFFNFSIPLNADPGGQDTAQLIPGGYLFKAKVIDESERMIFGKSEMVKEFLFEVLRQGDHEPVPSHYLHGRRLIIGAESGLIEAFTFNISDSENPLKGVLRLKHIVENLNEIRPGILDLFPFQPGDSLHVLETMETVMDNRTHKFRYEILDREYDTTSGRLEFTVKKEFFHSTNQLGDVYIDSGTTTVNWVIEPDKYLHVNLPESYANLLPGEQSLMDYGDWSELRYYHLRTGSAFIPTNDRREIHFLHDVLWEDDPPNCLLYSGPLGFPSYKSYWFIEDLGGPYYYLNELFRRPVFASTAEGRWGEPLDFVVSVDEVPDEFYAVKVFPNPVIRGEEIIIDFGSTEVNTVDLIDLRGTTVMSKPTNLRPELKMDSSPLAAGVYLVKATLLSGRSTHQLLIIN